MPSFRFYLLPCPLALFEFNFGQRDCPARGCAGSATVTGKELILDIGLAGHGYRQGQIDKGIIGRSTEMQLMSSALIPDGNPFISGLPYW